jgi:5'-methylthioadenosine phosphorylase
MSALPEAKLAREAEIAYQMVCMSTDYDCWREGEEGEAVSVEAVVANLESNSNNAKRLLLAIIPELEKALYEGALTKSIKGSMKFACVTESKKRNPEIVRKLDYILPGYY